MAAIEEILNAPTYEFFTGAQSEDNIRLYTGLGYELFGLAERGGVPLVFLEKQCVREVNA